MRQSRWPLALQLRPSYAWCSEIWLRDISITTNVTFHLGVGGMHMQGITRNNVKITFKSPRRLSNSTLRFSFSKIMLSPPGCLTSCLNSCLKHEIYRTIFKLQSKYLTDKQLLESIWTVQASIVILYAISKIPVPQCQNESLFKSFIWKWLWLARNDRTCLENTFSYEWFRKRATRRWPIALSYCKKISSSSN